MDRHQNELVRIVGAILSILIATLTGSVLLQSYLAISSPSSYGPFAEFPFLLFGGSCVVTGMFIFIVLPLIESLRYTQRELSLPLSLTAGVVIGSTTILLCVLIPNSPLEAVRWVAVVAGGVGGAIGVAAYAHIAFERFPRISLRTLLVATSLFAIGFGTVFVLWS
jgi:hypothetical protein